MKCPLHQGRGRAPKDCAACNEGKVFGVKPIVEKGAAGRAKKPVVSEAREESNSNNEVHDHESAKTNRVSRLPLSEDGLTWLDIEGNPPEYDSEGNLSKDFVLRLSTKTERFTVGCILPRVSVRS